MLSDAENNLLLYTLGQITADAIEGDLDAFSALEDDFWVAFITSLDNYTICYSAWITRVLRLRLRYKEGTLDAGILRALRSDAAFGGSKGG